MGWKISKTKYKVTAIIGDLPIGYNEKTLSDILEDFIVAQKGWKLESVLVTEVV